MKTIPTLLFLFLLIGSSAQVADRTETDCNGESRSVYQVGDEGKPLLVASKGFDCGNCIAQADDLALFAAQNSGSIEVWGAMTYTYSSATPTCTQVNNWSQTYNWDEVFSFPDVDEYWLAFGTPRYYVIHPQTRIAVYEGSSFSAASNAALELALTTSLEDPDYENKISIFHDGRTLFLNIEVPMTGVLRVYNLVGQEVFSHRISSNQGNRFSVGFSANEGIYIASFQSGNKLFSRKVLIRN